MIDRPSRNTETVFRDIFLAVRDNGPPADPEDS